MEVRRICFSFGPQLLYISSMPIHRSIICLQQICCKRNSRSLYYSRVLLNPPVKRPRHERVIWIWKFCGVTDLIRSLDTIRSDKAMKLTTQNSTKRYKLTHHCARQGNCLNFTKYKTTTEPQVTSELHRHFFVVFLWALFLNFVFVDLLLEDTAFAFHEQQRQQQQPEPVNVEKEIVSS